MGIPRKLSIEEKLEIHKREQGAHPDAMILVKDFTDVDGDAIVIRHDRRETIKPASMPTH